MSSGNAFPGDHRSRRPPWMRQFALLSLPVIAALALFLVREGIGPRGGLCTDARLPSLLQADGLLNGTALEAAAGRIFAKAGLDPSALSGVVAAVEAAAASAQAADKRAAGLEQRLQQTEQRLLEAVTGLQSGLAATAAAGDGGRTAALEQQLSEAEQRVADLEGKLASAKAQGQAGQEGPVADFDDIRTAVEADRRQLAALLQAWPQVLEARRQQISAQPQRGLIVSAATRSQLANAFVGLHVLRRHLNSRLPVAVTYWGLAESIPAAVQAFFKEHLGDVEFVDTSKTRYPAHQRPLDREEGVGEFGGFKFKAYGVYNAPFQEVISIDADCMPLLDPAFLFEAPEYLEYGNIFFPDRFTTPPLNTKDAYLFKFLGLHDPWGVLDRKLWPPQTETGQLVFNRQMHVEALEWLLFLNTHDEFTYRLALGDKDTFRAAFDLAGKRDMFFQSPHSVSIALLVEGGEYKSRGYAQIAPNGSATFVHRSWFMKYEPNSAELRSFTHLTVGLSDARAWQIQDLRYVNSAAVEMVQSEKCALDPFNVPGSLQKCGFTSADTSAPVPIFQIPETSTQAQSVKAGDNAFHLLRAAMSEKPDVLPP